MRLMREMFACHFDLLHHQIIYLLLSPYAYRFIIKDFEFACCSTSTVQIYNPVETVFILGTASQTQPHCTVDSITHLSPYCCTILIHVSEIIQHSEKRK